MDYRRDVLPPIIGVAASVALHAGLFWLNPEFLPNRRELDVIPIVVDFLPGAKVEDAAGETPSSPGNGGAGPQSRPKEVVPDPPGQQQPPPPPKPRSKPNPKPAPIPESKPLPAPRAETKPETQPKPEPLSHPLPQPSSAPRTEPKPVPKRPPPVKPKPESAPIFAAPKVVAPAKPAAPPPAPRASVVARSRPKQPPAPLLPDLMPTRGELAAYGGKEGPPDPAGGTAREATLVLGDTDVRYRGYLTLVQGAVDASWRWKEALLAAGRAGSVLLRFTLTPAGEVAEVQVQNTSGSPILDEEAAEAIRRASMPPFPNHWTIARLHLFAQFDYKLE